MAASDNYRKQHAELVSLVGTIQPLLKEPLDAIKVRKELSGLIGKLGVHLAMEDDALYPRMMKSPNKEASEAAQKFNTEMGGIKQVVKGFSDKWNEHAIAKDPAGFIKECKGLFEALAKRIQAENTVLYPLYDKIA